MIEIKLSACRLFLSEQEIVSLLKRDPDLWQEGIKRGKAITRVRQARERNCKTPARYQEPSGIL